MGQKCGCLYEQADEQIAGVYLMWDGTVTARGSRKWSVQYINTLRPRQDCQHSPNDILKCVFLNDNYEFQLRCHWSLFLKVQLTIFQHWFRQWLGADQTISHYLNQWWLVYWRIYASLGLNDLNFWYISNQMRKYSRWHISYNNTVIGLDFQLRFWYGIHKRIYFT